MRLLFLLIVNGISLLVSAQIHFPEDYLGTWKGNLKISPNGMEIPMTLQLGPATIKDSVYKYVLTYIKPNSRDVREYELHVVDRTNGMFYVDEKNGIILDEKLLGNKLSCVFSVSGSMLHITLTLLVDEIIFEVYTWPSTSSNTMKSEESGEVYTVDSYMTNAYQKAVLRR